MHRWKRNELEGAQRDGAVKSRLFSINFRTLSICVGAALIFSAESNAEVAAENVSSNGHRLFAQEARSKGAPDNACLARFEAFIRELDLLLASNPPAVTPLHDLINRYFPVEACDIEKAIEISRQSRFFSYTSEAPRYYLIAFDTRGSSSIFDTGYHVQIGFLKTTGNSWLPSANINP
jgi:hypothetical protein